MISVLGRIFCGGNGRDFWRRLFTLKNKKRSVKLMIKIFELKIKNKF